MDLVARLHERVGARDEPIWIVGGCVRDRLLGRASADIDAVTRGAVPLAKRLAREAHAYFVLLDDGRGTARVIARDRLAQLDLTELTSDIETDLRRRDFTINAIAATLPEWRSESPTWLDPCGGRADLAARRLRAVTAQSFQDDPLRVLRAYRFQALLNFALEPRTATWLGEAAPRLAEVAAERVLQEWLPLLAAPGAVATLATMASAGVLLGISGTTAPERVAQLEPCLPELRVALPGWLESGDRLPLLRFAALLGPESGGEPTATVARRVALSRAQTRRLAAFRKPAPRDPSRSALAELVLAEGEETAGIVTLAAAQGELGDAFRRALAVLAEEVFPVARSKPLVSGSDLEHELGQAPGPVYGPVLATVRLAELAGRVTGRDEALALAAEVLADYG